MEKSSSNKRALKKHTAIFLISLLTTVLLFWLCFGLEAQASPSIKLDLSAGETSQGAFGALEMLFLLAILALAPSILLMMTSFTRIIIVLSFLRNALGTQQSPPNQVLVGLSLFLTLFIMYPVMMEMKAQAYDPYKAGTITSEVAVQNAIKPLKVFMIKQSGEKELNLFLEISETQDKIDMATIKEPEELTRFGLEIIVPAFVTSELKRAFTIGFLLFIPFLIIDLVVSSTLMSMGMVMLPPSMIALPFKIMTFVLVDGWGLLIGSLAKGFRG